MTSLFEGQAGNAAAANKVPFLSCLNNEDINRIALHMRETEVQSGRTPIEHGRGG